MTRSSGRHFLKAMKLFLPLLTSAVVANRLAAAGSPHKPNILFILADDLGWADTSCGRTCYGHASDFYETPNIDRLAREGMSFSSAYACPNCAPSRAAIISGQYPPRTRVYNVGDLNRGIGEPPLIGPPQNQDVAAALTTMAEMLKSAGYETAHVGKYHVGGHEGGAATLPLAQGFDFNFGGTSAGNPGRYFAHEVSPGGWRFNKNIGDRLNAYTAPYDAAYAREYRSWAAPGYKLPATLYGTPKHVGDAVTDAALDFMEHDRTNGVPFFLEFNEYLVHTPLQGRPDLVAKYQAKKLSHPSLIGQDQSVIYAAMVAQFDQQVGRLLAYLNDPNGDGDTSDSIASNTLVVFFSDNGGYGGATSNYPLRGSKGMFTEGGIREPLVAWMPGTVPAGATNDTPVIMVDCYKTFADLAGAKLPDPTRQPLDGVSLMPLFRGQESTLPPRALYWHFPGYLDTRARPCSVIIKLFGGKRYKLLFFYETRSWSLYDLSDDLGESKDLFATPELRRANWAVTENLSADLRHWLDQVGAIYPKDRRTGVTVLPPPPLSGPPPSALN